LLAPTSGSKVSDFAAGPGQQPEEQTELPGQPQDRVLENLQRMELAGNRLRPLLGSAQTRHTDSESKAEYGATSEHLVKSC
jgi:hypothetical protein